MSEKNYVSYGDAETILTEFARDIKEKTDKVTSAMNGNFAGLNASGNLTDSGKKAGDFLAYNQLTASAVDDLNSATYGVYRVLSTTQNLPTYEGFTFTSGWVETYTDSANVVQNLHIVGYKSNFNAVVKSYTRSAYHTGTALKWSAWIEIADTSSVTAKTDKVTGATNGNLASLDANGNLADSGVAKTSLTFMDKSRYTVASSGWSVSTDADGYYTNAVSLSKNLDTTYPPNVYFDESVGNDNGEEDTYMTIDKFALTATGTLTAYATTKPTDSTYIYVEGRLA